MVSVNRKLIVNADLSEGLRDEVWYSEEAAIALMPLLMECAKKSMDLLRAGSYNEIVNASLPYWNRTGVIKRSIVFDHEPDYRERCIEGLTHERLLKFKKLLETGCNNTAKIGRLEHMTANDFFRACALGYAACGYDIEGKSPPELYRKYADGRDECLTGFGYGLDQGTGIDFDDPAAWDSWYFSNRGGGHPWEVCRGGNSTHVSLCVCHDRNILNWKVRTGTLSQKEAAECPQGYYFHVAGKHRAAEAVNFYLALYEAGMPVYIDNAQEILARFEGTDYMGIVPQDVIPVYCEDMFPKKYGRIIDFMHVYDDDMEKYKGFIEWLPLEPAALK